VNRRMRVRTYGGVGGREGNNPAYPILKKFLGISQLTLQFEANYDRMDMWDL
jgi:hypothetical protein